MVDVIECRDALPALRELPSCSADLLLTDPPYSSGGLFRGDRSRDTRRKYQTSGYAMKPLFFGDNRDERSFVQWSAMWMGECFRILRDGSSALVFTDWRQWANTADAMQVAGFVFRGATVWHKAVNLRPQPNSFRSECEFALWFTKGPFDRSPSPGAKYLPGHWSIPAPVGAERVHSTQKPLALVKALMEIAPEGAVVLDPFMGSGTTAVAAVETGRRFVGFEMSPEYCAVANERAARAKSAGGGWLEWLRSRRWRRCGTR